MTKLARLRRSRDNWKRKASDRAEQLRESRKTKARYQKRLETLRARIKLLEQGSVTTWKVSLQNGGICI